MLHISSLGERLSNIKKLQFGLIAVGLTAALALALTVSGGLTRAAVGGPTCHVPGDYPTIQAAVDDAGCSTVKVAAGTYTENVTISRNLTLKGAKAGTNAAWRSFPSAGESTVTGAAPGVGVFTVNAPDVTIDGFAVTNPGNGLGVVVKTAGSSAFIKNNIVDTIGGASFSGHTVGVYLEHGPDDVGITRNKIANIQSGPTGSAQGILVGDSTAANPSLDIYVARNTIEDLTSGTRGAYGVQVNNGSSTVATATGYTTIEIFKNKIQNLSGSWTHAIGLEGDTPDVVVSENTVSNIVDATPVAGVQDAIAVFFEANPSYLTAEVNNNSFNVSTDAYGIAVHPVLAAFAPNASVDGECNWWGHKSGPGLVAAGTGVRVGTNVDFAPWLVSPAPNGDCTGGVATEKKHCRNGNWENYTDSEGKPFKNQEQCYRFVEDNHDHGHHGYWHGNKDWDWDRR
jgi:hypothetical protein